MRILLIVSLLIISISVSAQEVNDSKLIISNDLTDEENYLAIGKALLLLDYEFAKKDDTFHLITTKVKNFYFKRKSIRYKLYIVIDVTCFDNRVVLTSMHKTPGTKKRKTVINGYQEPIEAFNLLKEVAEKVNGEISFEQ